MNSLIVMLGGACGALARYHLGRWAGHALGSAFPWGTLVANIVGGFAMGLLAGWLGRFSGGSGETARLAIGVGLLGGFTTFSAFSLETAGMIERGQIPMASAYVLASVLGAIGAVVLGLVMVRTAT